MADNGHDPSIDRFICLYALAWAGGSIAYTPLLTLLLPVHVAGLAGEQAGVGWLAAIALAGALAASFGGIFFGYLSDLSGNRRGWIAAGLVLGSLLLLATGKATSLGELIGVIVAWQLALNMMLGPLSALAGDLVPDHRKGLLGGLMAFAPAVGALAGAAVTLPGLAAPSTRLWMVAGLVILCVLPLLLCRPPPRPAPASVRAGVPQRMRPQGRVIRMWLARFAVQLSEATLFAYLFFWLKSLDAGVSDNATAQLFSLVLLASAPLALLAGRWSDRANRPMAPLLGCGLGAALGLVGMARATDLATGMASFGLFGVASAVFLALHAAQTLRILPRPERRGRDLGLFNLANTVPSLVMPLVVVALIPAVGYAGLFWLLAGLAGAAGLLLVAVVRETEDPAD